MTAPLKPAGRTLAEFQPLKPAEQKLLEACRQGADASISDKRPETASDNNTVRAAFLRFLALGGDEQAPVHEHGVMLQGAWVIGSFDLVGGLVPHSLWLLRCYFSEAPILRGSRIHGSFSLEGSYTNGLYAERMVCDGSVFLRNVTANGTVYLLGAQIGDALNCSGAKFNGTVASDGTVDFALVCDRVAVKGNVCLTDSFSASSGVRLLGTQIGGNLDCIGAKFNGAVASDGKLVYALACDGANVAGAFFFCKLAQAVNGVSLASVRVRSLADDEQAWGRSLILDGFVYGELTGGAPTNAADRIVWLNKQYKPHTGLNGDGAAFRPQPWRQLAHVLREMGHTEDARQVAIAFEHRLRKANLIGQTPKHWGKLRSWLYRNISRGAHWLFWVLTGYGYRPLRLMVWMAGVWLVCAICFWMAAVAGWFAPSDPDVFQNPNYAVCSPSSKEATTMCSITQGAGNWYLCEKLPEEYTSFSPLAYSLDVILPFVDLQQEKNWSPLTPTPKDTWYRELFAFEWSHWIRLVVWAEILFGWVASLLLVAVVSGLTKRREE